MEEEEERQGKRVTKQAIQNWVQGASSKVCSLRVLPRGALCMVYMCHASDSSHKLSLLTNNELLNLNCRRQCSHWGSESVCLCVCSVKPWPSPSLTQTNITWLIVMHVYTMHLYAHTLSLFSLSLSHAHTHTQNPSLLSLRSLCTALHDAITHLLTETEGSTPTYFLDDPSVFNSLVVSCIKAVPLSLSLLLLPRPRSTTSHPKTTLPSTVKGWSRVKTTVKVYLCDLLLLLERLKEPTMLCSLLKHIQVMADYYLCYPKLTKRLCKVLVKLWSEGESHVQVMAFMVLRRITLLQPHPALHHLLKVRPCVYVCVIICTFCGTSLFVSMAGTFRTVKKLSSLVRHPHFNHYVARVLSYSFVREVSLFEDHGYRGHMSSLFAFHYKCACVDRGGKCLAFGPLPALLFCVCWASAVYSLSHCLVYWRGTSPSACTLTFERVQLMPFPGRAHTKYASSALFPLGM